MNCQVSKWQLDEYLESLDLEIHLGKRSCGWQFHWQCQPDYYAENLESIKQFLSKDNIEIYDEYGEHFTLGQFINEEIGDAMYCDENHVNGNTYYDKYPNEKRYYNVDEFEHTSKDGLRFSKEDFS